MIAATLLALTLAQQPLPLLDSGVDHGNRAGLYDAAPFACQPNDEAAACVAGDDDDEL